MRGLVYNRFAISLAALALKGATPDTLALAFALGLCISCFPVLGVTTVLCTIVALALHLNLPATLLANVVGFPLQLLFMVPLARLGEMIFRAEHLSLDPARLIARIQRNPFEMTRQLWMWQWHAIVAWMVVAPLAVLLLTFALRVPLRKLAGFSTPPGSEEIDIP